MEDKVMTPGTREELKRVDVRNSIFRLGLSWFCYWLGDLIARPMLAFDWTFLYGAYKRLMSWADDLQGEDPRGPWRLDSHTKDSPDA